MQFKAAKMPILTIKEKNIYLKSLVVSMPTTKAKHYGVTTKIKIN
jgi:hypothetical protein